jgi:hypothetical protein
MRLNASPGAGKTEGQVRKFQINRCDAHGNIITGYEQFQENESREDAIVDYLAWLDNDDVTEDDLSVVEIEE